MVEMAENEDFLQKKACKTGFLRDTNRDQLTLERAGARNFKKMPIWIFSMKSMGHKVSNELWGGMLASVLSDRRAFEFFAEGHQMCKNGHFFAFSQIK